MFPLGDIAGPKFLKFDFNSNFKPNLIQKWSSLLFFPKYSNLNFGLFLRKRMMIITIFDLTLSFSRMYGFDGFLYEFHLKHCS